MYGNRDDDRPQTVEEYRAQAGDRAAEEERKKQELEDRKAEFVAEIYAKHKAEEEARQKSWEAHQARKAAEKKERARVRALLTWKASGGTEDEFSAQWDQMYKDMLAADVQHEREQERRRKPRQTL